MFSVKDKDLFGMANQYIAESLLSFETIFSGAGHDQIHLTLTRPNNLGKGCGYLYSNFSKLYSQFDPSRFRVSACFGAATV